MGRNKMLEVIAGKASILHVMDSLAAAELAGVIVALGHEQDQIRPHLADYDCLLASVPDYQDGLSRSLRAALAVVPPEWDAVFVCLGDMPLISPVLLKNMAQDARRHAISIPFFDGRMGNPVLWPRDFFPDLQALEGDSGGRQLFTRFPNQIRLFPAPDETIFMDLDTEEDLPKIARTLIK
jgi:molybdenum cofactor cytidylyltransferase